MIEAKCDNCGATAPTNDHANPPADWILIRRAQAYDYKHTCSPACAHAEIAKLETPPKTS